MSVSITVGGLNRVKKAVERIANVKAKCLEIARRLCEVGEPIIRATHGNHASVTVEQTSNGYSVRADGEDILFIEFGAGDRAGENNDQYDEVPAVAHPGTWSDTHAQMYSRYGFWVFAGKIYHYTDPHPAFYEAYKAMVKALPQIAKEVFGK